MNGAAQVVLLLLLLILPLSALIGRRVPLGRLAQMALAWIAIFAVVLVVVSGRAQYQKLWEGGRTLLFGADQSLQGGVVRIAMNDDGHFYADVKLNGVAAHMLIDSGATSTALSQTTAEKAGVSPDSVFPTMLETANGAVHATRGTVEELQLGTITARDLPVVVSPSFEDLDVIGMNFLSRLGSWRVEGRTLILVPQRPRQVVI